MKKRTRKENTWESPAIDAKYCLLTQTDSFLIIPAISHISWRSFICMELNKWNNKSETWVNKKRSLLNYAPILQLLALMLIEWHLEFNQNLRKNCSLLNRWLTTVCRLMKFIHFIVRIPIITRIFFYHIFAKFLILYLHTQYSNILLTYGWREQCTMHIGNSHCLQNIIVASVFFGTRNWK